MRYLLLSLLLLSLPRWGQAQISPVWDKTYGSALDEEMGFTVALPGGYLLLSNISYPGSPPVSFNRYLFLVRTNLVGDTLWTKKLVPPRTLQPIPTAMLRDAAGNLVITGFGYETNGRGFLLKLTPTGDTLWTKSSAVRAHYANPSLALDGNYAFLERQTAIIGNSVIYSSYVEKADANTGATIWRTDLAPVFFANGLDANSTTPNFLINSGNAFLCGISGRKLVSPPRGVEGTIVIANVTGNVSSPKIRDFSTPTNNSVPVVFSTADGNVIAGRQQMLTKLTPLGDTLWHTLVPRRLNRDWSAASLCEDAQGNYVVAGNSSFNIGSGLYADNVHLTRFRPQSGAVVNDTMLYRPGQTYAATVLRAANGHLVIGGWLANGPHGGSDAFLAEWTAFRPLAARNAATAAGRLQVYPNPATGPAATVRLPTLPRAGGTLSLFDGQGRRLGQQAVATGSTTALLPLGPLPPGLYLLRYEGPDGAVQTTRLLRQ